MVSQLFYLTNISSLATPCSVKLPACEIISITQSETVHVTSHLILHNVLFVPQFKFNLLSISKLTTDLNCVDIFFLNLCIFLGLCHEEAD